MRPGAGPTAPTGSSRLPLVALLVAALSGSIVLGLIAVRARSDDGAATRHASGLRAGALPEGLAGAPAPHVRLTDAAGGTIDTAVLRGRPYLVTFLYSTCPDVCPLIAEDLRAALAGLGDRASGVAAVAVSVDPRGDTRASVREFLRRHDLPGNFHYGIGSHSALAPVWEAYFAAPQISGRPETSTHTAAVWLVDAEGRLRGLYPAGAPLDVRDVTHDLGVLLDST
jgi:protein SCO1/2